jgi:hypothetical protein
LHVTDPDRVDLGAFSTISLSWSYAEVKFDTNPDCEPYPIPVLVAFITIPDDGHVPLQYERELQILSLAGIQVSIMILFSWVISISRNGRFMASTSSTFEKPRSIGQLLVTRR